MTDFIGYFLIIIGILFDIFGCIGLIRFPDVYNRLQASTKCVTLGTILLLVGVAVVSGARDTNRRIARPTRARACGMRRTRGRAISVA